MAQKHIAPGRKNFVRTRLHQRINFSFVRWIKIENFRQQKIYKWSFFDLLSDAGLEWLFASIGVDALARAKGAPKPTPSNNYSGPASLDVEFRDRHEKRTRHRPTRLRLKLHADVQRQRTVKLDRLRHGFENT